MPDLDTDRIALSNELAALSDRFALEAGMWALPEAKEECSRVARYLAQLSRSALVNSDLDVVIAYTEASTILIEHIIGTRRFFRTVLTPLQVRRG